MLQEIASLCVCVSVDRVACMAWHRRSSFNANGVPRPSVNAASCNSRVSPHTYGHVCIRWAPLVDYLIETESGITLLEAFHHAGYSCCIISTPKYAWRSLSDSFMIIFHLYVRPAKRIVHTNTQWRTVTAVMLIFFYSPIHCLSSDTVIAVAQQRRYWIVVDKAILYMQILWSWQAKMSRSWSTKQL